MDFLPAIDLADGQAVRLHQGVAGTEKSYGDPVEIAAEFAQQGAQWLHLVDLDAAFGRGSNAPLVRRIVRENPALKVEVSGGLRSDEAIEAMLQAGAVRVNLGTAAIENPTWCGVAIARFGGAIAVGLDVKNNRVASRGWEKTGPDVFQVLARLEDQGCARYVVTDVSRDGTLAGPAVELLRDVCAHTSAPVVASGGVASVADLRTLRSLGEDACPNLEGVISGKALYEGRFTIAQALEALA